MIEYLLENTELRIALGKLISIDAIDDTIKKMAPFAFETKYNKSLMTDDISD